MPVAPETDCPLDRGVFYAFEHRHLGVDSTVDLFPATRVGCDTGRDRKSTRLNSSHLVISYAVFCLKKKSTRLNSSHLVISYAVFCLKKKSTRLNSSHLVISYAVFCLRNKRPNITQQICAVCTCRV